MNDIHLINIDTSLCEENACRLFYKISGIRKEDGKHAKMNERAWEIREILKDRIVIKATFVYSENVTVEGTHAVIDEVDFECNAFSRIKPEAVEGAYVYVLTAGDYSLEDKPITDQLMADLWGTAFTDAGRIALRNRFAKEHTLSDTFGPGFYGMDMLQSLDIRGVVEPERIGVEIHETGIIVPVKSCSGIIFAVNEEYKPLDAKCVDCKGSATNCRICNVRDR